MKHIEKVTYVCPKCGAPFRSLTHFHGHLRGLHQRNQTKRSGPIGWKPFMEGAWVGLDAHARPWVGWRL